jgi:hypothetical protein
VFFRVVQTARMPDIWTGNTAERGDEMMTRALDMGGSIPMMRRGAIIFCKRDWA